MKNRTHLHVVQALVMLLIVTALLAGVTMIPKAQVEEPGTVSINKLDGVKVNLEDYFDSTVVHRLPDHIRDDEEISVIVTLDQINLMDAYEGTDKTMSFADYALNSSDAKALRSSVSAEQAKVTERLDAQGIAYSTGEVYDTLLAGFELVIQAGDYDAVCKSLDAGAGIVVGEVYEVAQTSLVENPVSVYETGIFKSGDSGYDGSGMVVAVLDTGLDSNHTAFSTANFTSQKLGLTYDQVAAVINKTKANELAGGLTVDDVYINEKVPFGYDYADNDPDVYSTHNNHGTHVSGVIVGKDDVITGVAPNAQLVSMKVFSDVMDTARSAWILSALEDCVVLGVDVINMSLGTACGFGTEGTEELTSGVYQKIRDAGISLIVAASNSYSSAYASDKNGNLGLTSNPDTGTVGSPGTYEGAMSVASIDGKKTPYLTYNETIIYFDESTNGSSKENDFVATLLGDAESKEMEYILIPGVGRSADYTGIDVTGKIVLVRRGDTTFEEKAEIAEKQGAAGLIIYNNVSGEIKMNVGKAKLAVCSMSRDDGEKLAAAGSGKLVISKSQTSGPFISSFSSWGPTPDLGIKPEITAHGGNILSSVTGGGYDRLSGTSMACPNLAGAVILLRQYVVEKFPAIANDNCKVNDMVNGLLMSTAEIALNKNGLPYFVRKQGAGLADLMNSINTTAYLTAYDKNGNPMDKPKLELGDDPNKTGVYTMTFDIVNFGSTKLSYDIGAYVMTEGVSDTKTDHGLTTVTEEARLLDMAVLKVTSINGGTLTDGKNITVEGGKTAKVTVSITLGKEDKEYLNTSFENGMYVEGYICLTATEGTQVDLNVPYLAFYGDWTVAPLFDLEYYDTHADELDKSKSNQDKVMADAYATRPVGGVYDDYYSYLGSYYFLQDPNDVIISANKDYIALSNQDGTIHSLRFVWAGLLRNAKKIEISIVDDTTGEVIFQTVDDDVRKSYGDGGSIYPANIEIEFDTKDYNLANNTQYTVTLVGYLDYGDGGLDTNKKNVFTFPLTVDFTAPVLTDVEFTYEYDKTLKKNRLYANAKLYDNHYSMAAQLGYVTTGEDENGNAVPELKGFEQYMTPIISKKNSTTTVKLELTDYIYQMKEGSLNDLTFALTCYDYALNYATYEVSLPVDFVDFYFADISEEGLVLSPNEVYTLSPAIDPTSDAWGELLNFRSENTGVVRVVNNKLVAVGSGYTTIKVSDPSNKIIVTFPVTVLAEGDEGYRKYDKPVADIFILSGYQTVKAYYMLNSEDKKIGDDGDWRFFEGDYNLSMYPSEQVALFFDLDAYFPKDTTIKYQSNNENIVKIDPNTGVVTAVAEGYSSVTVKVMMDDKSTYYTETVSVEVKDPYVKAGASLSHYYGNGGLVSVPADLDLTEIGNFAFSNYNYVMKTEEELAFDDAETSKMWYIGENTITKVILPEGIEKIGSYAFANLTALEEIVLPSTLEAIEYGAFYGCTSLKKITFSGANNLKIVNQHAFEGCNLQDTIDLSAACVISDYAFAGNTGLKGVTTSNSLLSIGQYAFAGCKSLKDVTITAPKVKYGSYAFNGCESLTSFYVNSAILPEGMFNQCKNLETVSIGPDVNSVGEFAFRETNVSSYEIKSGNKAFKVQTADYILSADGTTLIAVSAALSGEFTEANVGGAQITTLADGAFSHNVKLTSVNLPNVTVLGDYAFGQSTKLQEVTLGNLTKIGEYAFFDTDITELPAFDANTEIGKYAFAFTKVTSVTIPDGMTIAEGMFANTKELTSVTVGNDVTLGSFAFNMDKDICSKVVSYDENGERYFTWKFGTNLNELTIGNNVTIGENAFAYHANLEAVTLGENAVIGKQAFYGCEALESIDLSKATSIGDYAFSGDEYYICLDENMTVAAVSAESQYMTSSHATALKEVDLSSATYVGEYAFAMCEELATVTLGDGVTELPQYAFASCDMLDTINLSKVQIFGDYAFMDTKVLTSADLSSATEIGKYAFSNGLALSQIVLNPNGTNMAEGAFSYCKVLENVENLNASKVIGDYAFAYTVLSEADLTAAESIGKYAFYKEEAAPLDITLGENLTTLGDNPFAMCIIAPFAQEEVTEFNGREIVTYNYNYKISDTVQVIDGSLYGSCNNGLIIITYGGLNPQDTVLAEKTVRIGAMAFANSDIQLVTMQETTYSVGHKAFYGCDDLEIVVFGTYDSPILEEEFDPSYYESLEHIPGSGDFGSYEDYAGNEVIIEPMGLIPYFMWNATGGMYSNCLYGANFIDYTGYVEDKIVMVRPVNGQMYDSYILQQYFDIVVDGAQAPDKHTIATIATIDAIPEMVTYEQRDLVYTAREMYDKIATIQQKALVTNYDKLVAAEMRIKALTPVEEQQPAPEPVTNIWLYVLIGLAGLVVIGGASILVLAGVKSKKEQIPFAVACKGIFKKTPKVVAEGECEAAAEEDIPEEAVPFVETEESVVDAQNAESEEAIEESVCDEDITETE